MIDKSNNWQKKKKTENLKNTVAFRDQELQNMRLDYQSGKHMQ